jgi:1A family penicillin-binding protein
MAKSRRTKRTKGTKQRKRTQARPAQFYEAVPMSPGLGTLPLLLPATSSAESAVAVPAFPNLDPELLKGAWKRLSQDAGALWHDARRYGRLAAGPLLNRKVRNRLALAILGTAAAGTIAAVGIGASTMAQYGSELDNPAVIMNQKDVGVTILDRNGVVLYQGYGAKNRQNVTLDQVSSNLKQATIATEDPGFYSNLGISVKGTARAAYQDALQHNTSQGGSTIAQQLVKNTLLSDEKSFSRKYKEVVLAVALTQHYTKDQILQMYLNTIYYGEGAYGIQAASETYFHVPASQLNLDQAAMLAGLPESPTAYDPNVDPTAATARRNYVLSRMQQAGEISQADYTAAIAQPVVADARQVNILAPHFVFYVLNQLQTQYGEQAVEYGGITVKTTLNYTDQEAAQTIVTNQVNNLASHHVTNGGLISIDPHNGDILSMVGSTDYNAPGFGNVNVMLSQLQPGSSFKPIAYAEAFLKGYNGATTVQDEPECFNSPGSPPYCPMDYDLKWRGTVTLRRALANSLNLPAIHVLQYAGIPDTISLAHALGIQSPSLEGDPSDYGLSLVLGSGTVRPIDLTAVYAALDEGGTTVVPRSILSVTNRFGKNITKPQPTGGKQVLDPRVAYMLTSILSDDTARQEEFGVNNPLQLDRPAAAKTGTTNDFDDNWTIGYTPDVVTGVWVGNNDHTPMQNVDGITGAAPIWHDYMETVLAGTPVTNFTPPAGIVAAQVCRSDGGLDSNPNDASGVTEYFLPQFLDTKKCGSSNQLPLNTPATPAAPATTTPTPTDTTTPTPAPTTPGSGGAGGTGTGGGTTPGGGAGGGTTPPGTTPSTP